MISTWKGGPPIPFPASLHMSTRGGSSLPDYQLEMGDILYLHILDIRCTVNRKGDGLVEGITFSTLFTTAAAQCGKTSKYALIKV